MNKFARFLLLRLIFKRRNSVIWLSDVCLCRLSSWLEFLRQATAMFEHSKQWHHEGSCSFTGCGLSHSCPQSVHVQSYTAYRDNAHEQCFARSPKFCVYSIQLPPPTLKKSCCHHWFRTVENWSCSCFFLFFHFFFLWGRALVCFELNVSHLL